MDAGFITFYLREDDPDYAENDGNVLWQVEEMYSDDQASQWRLGHTEIDHQEFHPWFEGENHANLYHELYDHTPLDRLDLLRIGNIGIDLRIEEKSGEFS